MKTKHLKLKLATAVGCALLTTAAVAHDPGSAGPGTVTCVESNLMVADAQNTPFASTSGPGRVLEMNTTTGERGLTVGNPFTPSNDTAGSPICVDHVSCTLGVAGPFGDFSAPFKPTGILSGGENGHAYLVSAAQHALVEHHRNATAIRTSPLWPTDPSPTGGGFGFVPRLLGNGFMPNGNIAQTSCDANFFNAPNSDDNGSGGLEANSYFPPVNGTAVRGANGRVLVVDQNTLAVIDEYSKPTKGPYANDPRWNCPAGVLFTSEGMYVSMFHGDAVFVIDWKHGVQGKSCGVGCNKIDDDDKGHHGKKKIFKLGKKKNQAKVIRVIDLSNDGGPAGNHHALNYYDAPNFDSGHRRDNLRAIRMSEDGSLWGTRRSRSAECNKGDAGCNPGVFRQHVFVSSPGASNRSGSIALDPGANVLAGVTINRMSGPGCKFITGGLDPTTVLGDVCNVETLYVGLSAGNTGCDADNNGSYGPGHPANQCFKPGGKVYEYRMDQANWDATDGTCTGNPNVPAENTGCAQPIAEFVWTTTPGGTVENIDPRMVMTVHEAFTQ